MTTFNMRALLLGVVLIPVLSACSPASDTNIKTYGEAVAQEYKAWVGTADYQAWLATQDRTTPTMGYSVDCSRFSKLARPAQVKSCIEGPGAADGPTIQLTLTDGSQLSFSAYP